MFKRHLTKILIAIIFVFSLSFINQPTSAEWGVSFSAGFDSNPYDSYYGDRITSEYRRGYQTDDWVERGDSSVTESPIFSDGIRLTAWSSLDDNDYDYAIASAIYFFEIPDRARSIRIKVHYDGDGDVDDVNDEIAGRIWIRRTVMGDDFEEYYPSEGRYESVDKPLYGDTFALQAKKRLEIIRISARDHVDNNGIMELHIVAEGRQRIDVKYIEVETYTYMPNVRVVTRYYKDYTWRPWNHYTYWYFYTGPVFHFSDYYYVRYTYPYYHRHYIEIRRYYDDYLRVYYVRRPNYYHIFWDDVVYVKRGTPRSWHRERLSKWTPSHEEARKAYIGSSNSKTFRIVETKQSRERVRSVLTETTRRSPSADKARSYLSVQTRGASVTEMKQRRDVESRANPIIRMRTSESRSNESRSNTPTRTETSDRLRTKREETRTPTNIQKDSPSNNERERIIRTTPQRSPSSETSKPAPSNNSSNTEVKKRREVTEEAKKIEPRKSENVQRRESANEQKKDTEVKNNDKKDDDEDKEEEEKKKRQNTEGSSDSSSRKKVRGR